MPRLSDGRIPFLTLRYPIRVRDMQGDEFWSEFRLLERLSAGDVTTYVTQDPGGGRVMAHFFRGPPGQTRDLLARLDALPAQPRSTIRDVLEVEGSPVVITDFLEPFETFESWVSAAHAGQPVAFVDPHIRAAEEPGPEKPAPQEPAPAKDVPEEPPPGEFTRLFLTKRESAEREDHEELPEEAPAPFDEGGTDADAPARAGEAEPAGEASRAPGEFTRLFGTREQPATPEIEPPPPPAPASPVPPPPEAPGPAPRDADARPELGGASKPEPPRRSPSRAEPGEFTRMFGRGRESESDALAGRRTRDPSEQGWRIDDSDSYLRRLGGFAREEPSPGTGSSAPESAPPLPEPSPLPIPQGPSDYTRVVRGGVEPAVTPPPAKPVPAPAPRPKAGPSRWPFILIGGAILVITVLLFVFFASRGARDGAPADDAADEQATEEVVTPPEGEG